MSAARIAGSTHGVLSLARERTRSVARVWIYAFLVAALSLLTRNGFLTATSVLAVPVLFMLTRRPGEPPVLFFACLIQWLQSCVVVFSADFSGMTLAEMTGTEDVETAVWLSLGGLVALALGIRMALHRMPLLGALQRSEVAAASVRQLFRVYLAVFAITSALVQVAWVIPQFTQIIIALMNVKWVFAYLVAYTALRQRASYDLLTIMVLLELLSGFVSYFSSFNRILFLLLMVVPISGIGFTFRLRLITGLLATVVVVFSICWSAIKPEYRDYVNQGTGDQEVYVSSTDAVEKLGELVGGLDSASLERGMDALLHRIAYVHFFAATIGYVPSVVPHENGSLWLGSFLHILKPRLLFPDKPQIDDSLRTREYTGLPVAGIEEGTSVSIGYFGESYVDFGRLGMMLPIFCVGLLWGLIYRLFASTTKFRVLGFSIATSILTISAFNIGTSNVKLLGGSLSAVIVMLVVRKYLLVGLSRWCGISVAEARKGEAGPWPRSSR